MRLEGRALTGTIPAALGDLSELRWLHLDRNSLSGPIPSALGNLAQLRGLYLLGNQLTGAIPPELANLARLERLNLNNNRLTGPIPPELANLAQLRTLVLGYNRLTGVIPPALGGLAQLRFLALHENRLTGAIPPELGDLAHLTSLWLGGNRLTGAIPPELGTLARLGSLYLDGNRLTGAIPPELGTLARLEYLSLGGNRLMGAIPPALGNLARLEILHLDGNLLWGAIPPELGNLARLGWVRLAQNDLTGCLPRELAQVALNDLDQLGLASCPLPSTTLTYGAPVTTGSVTDAGDYAFLTDPDDLTTMITTYEGLRDGSTAGLVIHKNDSAGTSQADLLNLVEAGDLFEWRQASDCFVRYTVTEVKDDPAGDNLPPRKLLAVAWMTYAFTGCSGALSPTATASLQWGPLPDLGGSSLTAPILHGPFQIVPDGWTGERVPWEQHDPPSYNRDNERYTTDPAVARTYPYWREPALPNHWVLWSAATDPEDLPYGYRATWGPAPWDGSGILEILGGFLWGRNGVRDAYVNERMSETRVIAGRPAGISYATAGANRQASIIIYDPATEAAYQIWTGNKGFTGENLDALIDLARSLFEPPNAP